jgi:ubiquinone/menaquinone biosynthesis C-methylase UbiE
MPREIPSTVYDRGYLLSDYLEGFKEYRLGTLSWVKTRQLEMLALEPGSSMLEIGFGRGELLAHCARQGARITGLDYSRDAVEIARETLRGLNNGNLLQADCRFLPFGNRRFDRVFSGDVIEHLHFQGAIVLLREMHRVLKPGGMLLVHTTPNTLFTRVAYPWVKPMLRYIDRATLEAVDDHLLMGAKVHIDEYNLWTLRRAARRAGLRGARVWIDSEILRASRHKLTQPFSGNLLVRGLAALGRLAPVRWFFGNDLYLQYRKQA